jgi:hypothetical protein
VSGSGQILWPDFGSTATSTVVARSAAEMPVVIPRRASIETVKAVPRKEVLSATCVVRCNSSHRSSVSGKQIKPRALRAMKLIISGVTFSAAQTRSPSFSRSSSSTMMTIRPSRMSATAASIEAKGIKGISNFDFRFPIVHSITWVYKTENRKSVNAKASPC